MFFYTIQYNTIQYNTIQYNTIQYNTIQYNTPTFLVPVLGFSTSEQGGKFKTPVAHTGLIKVESHPRDDSSPWKSTKEVLIVFTNLGYFISCL